VPKMFLHAPQGAFTAEARARVAAELTELGMACERLIDTPQIRAGIWVYFVEHAPDTVFRAGRQAAEPIMSLKVYALKGGFNAETKTRMVARGNRDPRQIFQDRPRPGAGLRRHHRGPRRELGHVWPTGSPGGDADQGMI
jgi:phenylpyruvate tautomerase PptA (4-oxalocrotonate tautomerase family)